MSNFYPYDYDSYLFNPYNMVKGYNNEEGNFSTGEPIEDLKRHAILGDYGTNTNLRQTIVSDPSVPEPTGTSPDSFSDFFNQSFYNEYDINFTGSGGSGLPSSGLPSSRLPSSGSEIDYSKYKEFEKKKYTGIENMKKYMEQEKKEYKGNGILIPNGGKLEGIDKIVIIMLKGEVREESMREELNKVFGFTKDHIYSSDEANLTDTRPVMFLRPLNFGTNDITLERLRQERLIPHNNKSFSEELLSDKGEPRKGTISLSTTHYYILCELFKYNKTILFLESNSRFNSNYEDITTNPQEFIDRFNYTINKSPPYFNIIDLHSGENKDIKYNYQMRNYANYKLKELKDLGFKTKDTKANDVGSNRLWYNSRPVVCEGLNGGPTINLGISEGEQTKAMIFNPSTLLFYLKTPIVYPTDGTKNHITGYWNNGIGFHSQIMSFDKSGVSTREGVDAKDVVKSNFQRLSDSYINTYIKNITAFNKLKEEELFKLVSLYNKSQVENINGLNNKVNEFNFQLDYNYYNLTYQLCDTSKNNNARLLQEHLRGMFSNFDIQKYHKLNPSIIKLDDEYILMSYRIYIGEINCTDYSLKTCHPWNGFWKSDIFDYPQTTKLNYNGLAKIRVSDMTVVEDTILHINDIPLGLEDVRLLKSKNDIIYIEGAVTLGKSGKPSGTYYDDRILHQGIVRIGSIEELQRGLPQQLLQIKVNCVDAHSGSDIQKNWFGYNDGTNDILLNPTFGKFFPLLAYEVDYESQQSIDTSKYYGYYNNIKGIKCSKILDIAKEDFITPLTIQYKDYLKEGETSGFRFSGGSWGVNYDDENVIFIGHIVAYLDKFDMNKVKVKLDSNYSSNTEDILIRNLFHLLYTRPLQLSFFQKTMRYFCFFIKLNKSTRKITELSHLFSYYKDDQTETGVNFPIGLDRINNDFYISLGESDYNTIIVKLNKTEIDKLFNVKNINGKPQHLFLTYDANGRNLNYGANSSNKANRKFFKNKYYKYKNKYLKLQKIKNQIGGRQDVTVDGPYQGYTIYNYATTHEGQENLTPKFDTLDEAIQYIKEMLPGGITYENERAAHTFRNSHELAVVSGTDNSWLWDGKKLGDENKDKVLYHYMKNHIGDISTLNQAKIYLENMKITGIVQEDNGKYSLRRGDTINYTGVNEKAWILKLSGENLMPQPPSAPATYEKGSGKIRVDILQKLQELETVPNEFKSDELRSAIVWGALNRARDRVPGLFSINDVALVNYISFNPIILNMETNKDKACEFVRTYDKLSKNKSFVTKASNLLGL